MRYLRNEHDQYEVWWTVQIIPAYFLWIQQGLFIRHRTLIYSI